MIRNAPLTDFDSIASVISQLRIFGGVSDSQWKTIFRHLRLWKLAEGEFIFRKGEEPLAIHVVKSGRINVEITENDVTIRKHELCVGESFGEASLLSMHCHTASARAGQESEIVLLTKHALYQIRHEDIELFALLMMNLARELARRLYLTDQMLLKAAEESGKPARRGMSH